MFDDFFIRAVLAAIGIAIVTGPLGCFVVWQRLSYFGDTIAHSSLLGVALALFLQINITLTVFLVALLISAALYLLQSFEKLSSDSILGILAHSTIAIGLVLIGFMPWVRVDLISYLFGDILAASPLDLYIIWGGAALILTILLFIWQPLLTLTVSEEIAQAENMKPKYIRLIFMIILALIIAIAMKLVGILLITALLVIPSATARQFTSAPETMAFAASSIGALAAFSGLVGSYYFDTSSGASIVVCLFLFFIISRIFKKKKT